MAKALPIGTTWVNPAGYIHIKTQMGLRRWPLEHRVVWEKANGPIPPKGVIHHRNGVPADNRLENLELCLDNGKGHLREKHLDKFRTPEFKAAVSVRFKGTTKSPQTRARISRGLKKAKALPENFQKKILHLRRSGLSMKSIALQVPRSPVAIFRFLKRHGDVIPEELKKPAPWGYRKCPPATSDL